MDFIDPNSRILNQIRKKSASIAKQKRFALKKSTSTHDNNTELALMNASLKKSALKSQQEIKTLRHQLKILQNSIELFKEEETRSKSSFTKQIDDMRQSIAIFKLKSEALDKEKMILNRDLYSVYEKMQILRKILEENEQIINCNLICCFFVL